MNERESHTEEIKHINRIRGPKTPEDADFYVREGIIDADDKEWWLEHRRQDDAFLESEAKRLRPGGGRPKSRVDRDALIYCFRECGKFEYYKIGTWLAARGLKVPVSPGAYHAARRAGLKRLQGRPCFHTELLKFKRTSLRK
ncbi:MAG: hypothetical protein IH822_03330 [Chloroflexi bacterium]|nr:hypothetical protein [Chloroflexota bacterium]